MRKSKVLRSICVFVLTFILSCSGMILPDSGVMSVRTVRVSAAKAKINKSKKTMYVGDQYTLKIKNASKKYTWTSSDPSVVKVKTKSGKKTKIIAVSAGKATITATLGGKSFTCKVTVKKASGGTTPAPTPTAKPTSTPAPTPTEKPTPTPIPVCEVTTDNKASFTVPVGGQLQLRLAGKDASKFSVSDKTYLEVSSAGLVTGKKASYGSIKVTVIDKFDNRYYCNIKVTDSGTSPTAAPTPTAKPTATPTPKPTATPTPKPTATPTPIGSASPHLDKTSVTLDIGDTYQIKLIGTDIMFCAQNEWGDDYADLTENGKITAKKACRKAVIAVYGADMKMYTFYLTINNPSITELTDAQIDALLAKNTYGIITSHAKQDSKYRATITYDSSDENSMVLDCQDAMEQGATRILFSNLGYTSWVNTLANDLTHKNELDGYYSDGEVGIINGRLAFYDVIYKVGWKAVLALRNKQYPADDETMQLLRDAYRLADKAVKLYPDDTRAVILYLNNTLCDMITYSDPFPPAGDVPQRDATGAFYQGDAVCEGYTSAMRLLLNILGLENKVVRNKKATHLWNYVKLNGTWYHLDVTWNDVQKSDGSYYNTYFLLTDSQMKSVNSSSSNPDRHDWAPFIK